MIGQQIAIDETTRPLLRRAFAGSPRVDIGIEAVIESGMGTAWLDNIDRPTSFWLQTGPFVYLAGSFDSPEALDMIYRLDSNLLVMSCPDCVIAPARAHFGRRFARFVRHSFDSGGLSRSRIESILSDSPLAPRIAPVNRAQLMRASELPDHFLDISAYRSADDFLERGVGYGITHAGELAAVAYASLATDRAIEVSIYVEPQCRRRGMATALGAALVANCLDRGLEPHWDAANLESCALAEKLGYTPAGTYTAFYLRPPE